MTINNKNTQLIQYQYNPNPNLNQIKHQQKTITCSLKF